MIRALSCAALLSVVGHAVCSQGEEIKLNPGNEPLRSQTLDKPSVVEAAFPFASTERKSFTATVKVDVDTWNHYASLRTGFRNSQFDDRFEALMSKGDDGLRGVAMDLEVASGAGFRSTLCHIPPDMKSFTITFKYNANRSRFKMIVSHDKRILGESDWTKIRGYFTLDKFVVQVGRGKAGLEPDSSISWDPKSAAVRAVSHTGNEGHYKYLLDALVKEATLQTE